MSETMRYRADIDGLRAIAVLAVLVYHARPGWMPGGFVGVDIFFVISGYLISGHLYRDALAGRMSYADFYARRVRRILPALMLVTGATIAFGLVCMTPLELRELGKEVAAALFGLSNVYYFTGANYFAPTADKHALLMTWSLGVEEQFYLLFPPLLMLLMKLRRVPPVWGLAALMALSFALSLWLTQTHAKAAFYLPFTRAWELGAGALIAVAEAHMRGGEARLPGRAGEAAGLGALALFAAAIACYDRSIAFPGLYALLPVAGAVLALIAGGSWVNRVLLSAAPMRFVGKISYSLYLWHWPLFYALRLLGLEPGGAAMPLVLALLLLLAFLSWRFVEQPLRRRVLPRGAVLLRYAGAVTAMALVGAALWKADGVPRRLDEGARQIAGEAAQGRNSQCLALYGETAVRNPAACLPGGDAPAAPPVILMGDSHANALAPALAQAARAAGRPFWHITKASCLPLADHAEDIPDRPAHYAECLAYQQAAYALVERHGRGATVLLAGYWAAVREAPLRSPGHATQGDPLAVLGDALAGSIARLRRAGAEPVVVADVPHLAFDPYERRVGALIPARRALATALGGDAGEQENVTRAGELRADPSRPIILQTAKAAPGVRLVDPYAALCAQGRCRYGDERALYYVDWQHLTPQGARAALGRVAF